MLDDVIRGSSKMGSILRIIETMLADQQKRPRKDTSGKPRAAADDLAMKKMVIVCPRLAEAVFVYLAIEKHARLVREKNLDARVDLEAAIEMDPGREDGRREEARPEVRPVPLVPAGDQEEGHGGQLPEPQRGSIQVFVTSFEDGGTGLNLFAANYQIQTGPLRLKGQTDQSFGRTNRQGQQLPCHHTLLVTEDNPPGPHRHGRAGRADHTDGPVLHQRGLQSGKTPFCPSEEDLRWKGPVLHQ